MLGGVHVCTWQRACVASGQSTLIACTARMRWCAGGVQTDGQEAGEEETAAKMTGVPQEVKEPDVKEPEIKEPTRREKTGVKEPRGGARGEAGSQQAAAGSGLATWVHGRETASTWRLRPGVGIDRGQMMAKAAATSWLRPGTPAWCIDQTGQLWSMGQREKGPAAGPKQDAHAAAHAAHAHATAHATHAHAADPHATHADAADTHAAHADHAADAQARGTGSASGFMAGDIVWASLQPSTGVLTFSRDLRPGEGKPPGPSEQPGWAPAAIELGRIHDVFGSLLLGVQAGGHGDVVEMLPF